MTDFYIIKKCINRFFVLSLIFYKNKLYIFNKLFILIYIFSYHTTYILLI